MPQRPAIADIEALLRALTAGGVEAIVVGGALGPLDILLRLHDARGYLELLPHSQTIVDGDLSVRVIDLETLIEIKKWTGRARDALAVPLLTAIRDRRG